MNKFILRQSLLLLLTAFIWGVAFVAQSVAMDSIGPFTFVASRNILAVIALFPVVYITDKKKMAKMQATEGIAMEQETGNSEVINGQTVETPVKWYRDKNVLKAGICCGFFLCTASLFQQFGIQNASTGKAGFLTALYIILVPVLGIFLHKKVGTKVWISVGLALIGVYLLCAIGGLGGFQKSDFLLLGCALLFSGQILAVDHFVEIVDGVKIAWLQFLFTAIVCTIAMFLFEQPSMSALLAAAIPILYAGLLSSGVAYTLQIIGQRGMNPTVASLIMSLESVFSALAGWVILHQVLSTRELIGCILVFAAIILAQLPEKAASN